MSISPPLSHPSLPPESVRAPSLLIVDPEDARADRLAALFARDALAVAIVANPLELIAATDAIEPDIVLYALDLEVDSAREVVADFKATEVGGRTPFLVVTTTALPDAVLAALLFAGADDVIVDATHRPAELRARIRKQLRHRRALDSARRLRTEREALRRDAHTDPLTGVWNRRAFETVLDGKVETAEAFSILFVDVDHFKRVNDELGHEVGDAVLVRLAELLCAHVRPGDGVARLGGEEFVVIAHGANSHSAMIVADRLRQRVAAPAQDETLPRVTISIGVASFDPTSSITGDELLRRADSSLYAAKRGGRDRVVVWSQDLLTPVNGPSRRQSGQYAALNSILPTVVGPRTGRSRQ